MFLILNVGSSSFKYAVFDQNLNEMQRGAVDNFPQLLDSLKKGFIPKAVGHRVVHGGAQFSKPLVVDNRFFSDMKRVSSLAPLHNKPALKAIKECMDTWGEVPNVVCFDTSFYKNLPLFSKIYALPFELYEKSGIQRFGFHGLSHQYVAQEAARQLGKDYNRLKLITCHLGSGCSITAIEDGQPIDTSMGFTPMEGLVMATRSGDVDPGVILFLQRELGLTLDEVEEILNNKSGLLGISGFSADSREILAHSTTGLEDDELPGSDTFRSGLALQVYAYRIKKYIGAYFVALGGLDALVFTGAVGSGADFMRNMITNGLEVLGDFEVLTIKTNEELVIAQEVQAILSPTPK